MMDIAQHLGAVFCGLGGVRGPRGWAAVREGCKQLTRVVRHQRFDATKGYHGEGPDMPADKVQQAMQHA